MRKEREEKEMKIYKPMHLDETETPKEGVMER